MWLPIALRQQRTLHDLLQLHLENVHFTLGGYSVIAPLDMVDGED